ncbi:MAG: helicase-related protein [Senegalimassilia faecalis]
MFGDMTLSYIHRRPHDAARRTTHVLAKADQGQAYDAARAALERGEQVYVVCPLIGQDGAARDSRAGGRRRETDEEAYEYAAISIESDGDFSGDNVTAATKEAAYLQETVFADWRVELLHGRMKAAEKDEVMARFRANETQVLVATTVIEVGVDVPNATVMIVADADRFGLAQLHQLRGRVGRGEKPAQVFLLSASKSEASLARLAAMEHTDDGFELAKYDLSLRREGDILGNRQSGASVLKLVNVVRDERIIEAAHADAAAIMAADAALSDLDHQALALEVRRTFPADAAGAAATRGCHENHRGRIPRTHAACPERRRHPSHHRPRARIGHEHGVQRARRLRGRHGARRVRRLGGAGARSALARGCARRVLRARPGSGEGAAEERGEDGPRAAPRYRYARRRARTRAAVLTPPFDLVFLDPPYAYAAADVLGMVAGLVERGVAAPDALVVYERRAYQQRRSRCRSRRMRVRTCIAQEVRRYYVDVLCASACAD